jgi:hypothetical protein
VVVKNHARLGKRVNRGGFHLVVVAIKSQAVVTKVLQQDMAADVALACQPVIQRGPDRQTVPSVRGWGSSGTAPVQKVGRRLSLTSTKQKMMCGGAAAELAVSAASVAIERKVIVTGGRRLGIFGRGWSARSR